jgi:hypothetical protein
MGNENPYQAKCCDQPGEALSEGLPGNLLPFVRRMDDGKSGDRLTI